jgi:hypothetical protein
MVRVAVIANLIYKDGSYVSEAEWRLLLLRKRTAGRTPPDKLPWVLRGDSRPLALGSVHVGAAQGDAGVARATEFLGRLGYGTSAMPLPTVVVSSIQPV